MAEDFEEQLEVIPHSKSIDPTHHERKQRDAVFSILSLFYEQEDNEQYFIHFEGKGEKVLLCVSE